MVDIQHTSHILQNLASQTNKASSSSGTERKESTALDSQFDAALEELNKESVSELDNALAEELVNQSDHAEMAHLTDDSDVDEEESFKQDYGIAGREEGDQNQQGRGQKREKQDEDEFEAPIAQALHDEFELAVHSGGPHDEESQFEDSSKSLSNAVESSSARTLPDEITVFDLVPRIKTDNGEEGWVSEISLEEIFADTLGQENTESSPDVIIKQIT